jgi:hypothetical protein
MAMRDVSDWERIQENQGSREGFWLQDLSRRKARRALLKFPREFKTHTTGEVWAEYIAMRVGQELSIPVPQAEIAICDQRFGILVHSFLEPEEALYEGATLTNTMRDSGRLTLADVREALSLRIETDLATAYLTNMVCFDILVANPDRHQENWGIIVPETRDGISRVAPLYDNGSSLGSNLDERLIIKILDDGWSQFDSGFHYEIEIHGPRKPRIHELLAELRGIEPALAGFDKRLSQLTDETVNRIVSEVPDEVIHSEQRTFASELLKHRRDLILRF